MRPEPAPSALPGLTPSLRRPAIEQSSPAESSHLISRLFRFGAHSPSIGSVTTMRRGLFSALKTACRALRGALPILLVFLTSAAAAAQSIPGQLDLKALFAV